jgi:hypothetical protein
MKLDFGAPFGFFLKDRAWLKKVVLASLLTYTIIGITPVLGWTLEIARQVGGGAEAVLPEWTGIRQYWKAGLKYWLLNLAWLMPVIPAILVIDFPIFFLRSTDPTQLIVVELMVVACLLAVITVYGLLAILLMPAALGSLACRGSLRQAVNPAGAWRLTRAHLGPHLVVFLIFAFGWTTVLSMAGLLTLFLAVPPLLVYTWLILAHFSGQLYRLEGKSASPLALPVDPASTT